MANGLGDTHSKDAQYACISSFQCGPEKQGGGDMEIHLEYLCFGTQNFECVQNYHHIEIYETELPFRSLLK